jgi:hypothetical protein
VDTLTTIKDWSIVVAGIVALTTFLSGVLEYARQGHNRRAENFLHMRRRFLETPLFRDISNMLQTDDPRLRDLELQDRRNYVGFLEEVALMVESKLLAEEVAHIMFGYYVLLVDRSQHLWDGLDRTGRYWTVFRRFASKMGAMEAAPVPTRLRI